MRVLAKEPMKDTKTKIAFSLVLFCLAAQGGAQTNEKPDLTLSLSQSAYDPDFSKDDYYKEFRWNMNLKVFLHPHQMIGSGQICVDGGVETRDATRFPEERYRHGKLKYILGSWRLYTSKIQASCITVSTKELSDMGLGEIVKTKTGSFIKIRDLELNLKTRELALNGLIELSKLKTYSNRPFHDLDAPTEYISSKVWSELERSAQHDLSNIKDSTFLKNIRVNHRSAKSLVTYVGDNKAIRFSSEVENGNLEDIEIFISQN